MKLTLWEKYGVCVMFVLLSAFTYFAVGNGWNASGDFVWFFPLHWIRVTPFSAFVDPLLDPLRTEQWWQWAEMCFTVSVWMMVFFLLRGLRASLRETEYGSMWIAVVIFVCIVLIMLDLVLAPTFEQLAIWWMNWPGRGGPRAPGG
jgi:hypothetical protein